METCSVVQKARVVLIALLTVFSARCAARSFTGSIDTDRTVMTESYFPFNVTDSEEITALPTEFVSTATSSTRGTVTEWGNSASTEITDPLPGFSKEQQPPTEADSATEVNANTGVSTDTENWESPSLTDNTYTSSTISRAGERTLLSVTTNTTAPYTENSFPYSKNTSPYSEDSSPYSKNTSPSSENATPSSENSSPYSKNTFPSSENASPSSENTSPSSENSSPSSKTTSSSENSSPSSKTTSSSENSSPSSKTTSSSENSSPSSKTTSSSENTSPSSENPSPSSENSSPSSKNTSPSSENSSPYSKNTSPSSENTSPSSENTSPSSENTSHSSENTSSSSENTSSSSENPSSDSKNTSPSSENPSPYSKNTSPSSEISFPSSENSSPYPDSSSRSSENSSHFSDNPSPYTEVSNSSQTYSQGFTREGRSGSTVNGVSTNGATSPRFDQSDTTSGFLSSHSPTNESAHSETGLPSDISQQSSGTASDSTQNSTPPLTVTNSRGREGADVTDSGYTSQAGTSQMETGSPVPHKEDHAPNTSRPGKESAVTTVSAAGTTTESSTGPFRPPAVDHTEDDAEQASSTAPPRVNDTVTTMDVSRTESPAHTQPFTPETEVPADSTEVLATATQTNQFAEEDTFRTTTGATTTPSTPAATTSMYQPSTSIEPSTQPTITTTTAPSPTTPGPQATPSTSQHLPPSRTGETSTHSSAATSAISTDITTLHLETSTATPGKTTHRGRHTTASYSNTAPSRTTPAHTTGNLTDRATTTFEATTTQMHIISTVATGSPCDSNPCGNGGTCVAEGGNRPKCLCLPSWTGSECDEDMDECVTGPCPPGSSCMNMRGSFSCVCPLGSDLENGRACTRARTFLGTFQLSNVHLNSTHPMSAGLHELQREIAQLLNNSLSSLKGYSRSTLNKREGEGMRISAVHTFSMSAEVTRADVTKSIETVLESCRQAVGHCRVVLHHTLQYTAESLCAARKTQCDTDRSNCTDTDGTTFCQCRAGYFKHNTEDQSCRECNDGYKLENGTCVRCTFGFGGFNCGNFYKLITVVVSPAGGALLLILVIALIVTCCKKDKNDINKIIFKSGDFQISPYAEYPKSNRVSMEWGRETIEMQENGSTKNLLQMTDIYYSPALRNSELERSGLYPFSGMPGSRHSCIYPAQWNPSFISDDTRRRDYF